MKRCPKLLAVFIAFTFGFGLGWLVKDCVDGRWAERYMENASNRALACYVDIELFKELWKVLEDMRWASWEEKEDLVREYEEIYEDLEWVEKEISRLFEERERILRTCPLRRVRATLWRQGS